MWFLEERIPELSEVRGKIVLMRRFEAATPPLGFDATQWPDDTTFGIAGPVPMRIEDEYYVPTIWNIDDRWDAARKALEVAPG